MTIFIVIHFVKSFLWYLSVFNQYSYYCDLFCLGGSLHPRERHCHGLVHYIDTKTITVLIFLSYCLVFIQYIYYRDFFCLGPASHLRNCYRHLWVRYIDTTKIKVACMSSLLLSIDLLRYCYFVIFYLKLTNGAMVNGEWWNGVMEK